MVKMITSRTELPEPERRRELRRRAGVPVHVLAAEIGVSPASIYSWEAGRVEPIGLLRSAYAGALVELAARTADGP